MKKVNAVHKRRIKKLLLVTGITGVELSDRTGTSYPLFLKVSRGERNITAEYAEQIMVATGIDPSWLLGETGKDDEPMGIWKEIKYDEGYFREWSSKGGRKGWLSEVNSPEYRKAIEVMQDTTWSLLFVSFACFRSNHLFVLRYYLFKLMAFISRRLKLHSNKPNLDFLDLNPFTWTPLRMFDSSKAHSTTTKAYSSIPERAITLIDDSDDEDVRKSRDITTTFNPIFLIEMAEALKQGSGSKQLIKQRLERARMALDDLNKRLSSRWQ